MLLTEGRLMTKLRMKQTSRNGSLVKIFASFVEMELRKDICNN